MKGLVVPSRSEDFTADPVELFFDLAFVFAFSQLVSYLVHDPTWKGASEAALLFMILWLAWSTFTWAANAVSGNRRDVRAVFLVATAASVPMGASVTKAFGSGGSTFAIGASIIVLMGIGLQLWALGSVGTASSEFKSVLQYSVPNLVAIAMLIVGSFLDGGTQKLMWTFFVLAVAVGVFRARQGVWIVRAGHFAERHGLIVIIALGEIVVAIGISVVSSLDEAERLPNDTLVALAAAGVMAGLLWWGYFDRVSPAMEHRAATLTGRDRARFVADVFTVIHIFIVGGIIAMAAAAEEMLLQPTDAAHTEFLLMFVGGLALFYGGIAAAVFHAYRALAKERLLAVAAIAALAYVGRTWNGVALLIAVDVVLLTALLAEQRRIEQPAAAHAPA